MIELAAGALVMVIEFSVIPEKREDFVAISSAQTETVRARAGNQGFDVLVDPKRPEIVAYVERWESGRAAGSFLRVVGGARVDREAAAVRDGGAADFDLRDD